MSKQVENKRKEMISFASKTNNPNTKLGWNDRLGYGMGNFGMA